MSTDTMQYKIQSLEHSLLFLQEQHASTLNGLHEEISKLQSKCTSLIHQLAQSGLHGDASSSKEGSSRTDVLESKLKDSRVEYAKLKDTLETKEERILMLEAQSKSKEQKYLNDLKHYQRKAAELQNELEHKSASIAYLTTKLHQSKVKDTILTNEAVVSGGNLNYSPSPPRGNSSRQHERKNIRCFTNTPAANVTGLVLESTSFQDTSDYILQNSLTKSNSGRPRGRHKHSISDPARPALGFSQNKRDRDMILLSRPKPTDYEDFIKINQSEETITKPIIEPLPPITSRSGKPSRQSRGKTFSNKNTTAHTNSSGEVETVIVEPGLSSPDRPYGKLENLT